MSSMGVSPIYAPVYAAVALCGLVSSAICGLVSSTIKGGATAATMPALAAAGLVWQTKSLITKEESSLAAQPSILNWHDLPVDLE